MWVAFLSVYNLPSLSYQLWVAACLASLLPLGLAFYVAVKLRKLNAFKEKMRGTNGSLGWNGIVLRLASFRPTEIKRVLIIMILASCSTFAIMKYSGHQRGLCTPTGDITASTLFTIQKKISPDCYAVIGNDGIKYDFCVNPTTPTDWKPGTFVEFAYYEFRDGYADFTVPGAKFKKWPNQEAYYESRKR